MRAAIRPEGTVPEPAADAVEQEQKTETTPSTLDPNGYSFVPAIQRWHILGTRHHEMNWQPPLGTRRPGLQRVEGPILDGLHRYVAEVWMVPHETDLPNRGDSGVQNVLGGAFAPLSMIPIIGWLIAAIALIPYALIGRGRSKENNEALAKALEDPGRPWAWMLTRTGPTPWPFVSVGPDWLETLGLRSPTLDASGRYVVEQIEPTREAAIAAGKHAANTLRWK